MLKNSLFTFTSLCWIIKLIFPKIVRKMIFCFYLQSFLRFLAEFKIGLVFKISLGMWTTFSTWGPKERIVSLWPKKTAGMIAVMLQKTYFYVGTIPKILPKKWKYHTYYLVNFTLITLRRSLISMGDLVRISIISRCGKYLRVKKIRMLTILKLS